MKSLTTVLESAVTSLYESLLDDFDKMSDFQDIEMILDDPNFNKNNFNKLKRLFKKAGGGKEYTKEYDSNSKTFFIAYNTGKMMNTNELVVGIPAGSSTLIRTYYPGYRHVHDSWQTVKLRPTIWGVVNIPAKKHFGKNDAGPISIPDKYVSYFKELMSNSLEYGSKDWEELNSARKRW